MEILNRKDAKVAKGRRAGLVFGTMVFRKLSFRAFILERKIGFNRRQRR